jgi:hypothetical protein
MPHSAPLEFFFNALAVPPDERQLPLQRELDTGHLVEIRAERGRHFLIGLLHELPIEPNNPLIESLLEEPFQQKHCGFLAYEPIGERLVYWSEILPAAEPGGLPTPDLSAFLRDLTEFSKKVSLAGAL